MSDSNDPLPLMRSCVGACVRRLNSMLYADRNAVGVLIGQRTVCNEVLAEHPSCQCYRQHGGFSVSPLGFINGMFPASPSGHGAIMAVFEDVEGQDVRDIALFEINPRWEAWE